MTASPSPLARLRLALLHALGLTAAFACHREPLDDAATATTTTTTAPSNTTTAGTTPPELTTDPVTTGGTASTTDPVTTGGTASTTLVVTSGTTAETTDPLDPATTTTTGPIEPGTTTTTTTGTTGPACLPSAEFGTEVMPADVMELPGCEQVNADICTGHLLACVPRPDGRDGCDACAPDCLGPLPELCDHSLVGLACGPVDIDGQCCHVVEYFVFCGDGRPFLVHGTARTADLARRRDWLADLPGPAPGLLAGLDPAERAELAALWTADALAEHASVASFARFTLQLLALAAPPALVQDAVAAQHDELVHARLTFALASHYAGAPVGPGALALGGALDSPSDLAGIVVAVVREGCIGETLAAAELDMAARTCDDPALAATLRRIAADEQRHAALAWRTLQWALGRGGPALRRAVAEALTPCLAPPPADRLDPALLRRHGRLPADERAALAAQCMHSVILPCARALLGDDADAVLTAARA